MPLLLTLSEGGTWEGPSMDARERLLRGEIGFVVQVDGLSAMQWLGWGRGSLATLWRSALLSGCAAAGASGIHFVLSICLGNCAHVHLFLTWAAEARPNVTHSIAQLGLHWTAAPVHTKKMNTMSPTILPPQAISPGVAKWRACT